MAMEHRLKQTKPERKVDKFELDALRHPTKAFAHPMDVVRDVDLTLNEKRAILASWASDACALEVAPELRMNGSGAVVRWDDVMDALHILDREADKYGKPLPHYKRVLASKDMGSLRPHRFRRRTGEDDEGRALN
jgi:hypothetical protein